MWPHGPLGEMVTTCPKKTIATGPAKAKQIGALPGGDVPARADFSGRGEADRGGDGEGRGGRDPVGEMEDLGHDWGI